MSTHQNKQFSEPESDLLSEIMAARRDVRGNRFLAEALNPDDIDKIFAAALMAPSVGFSQPWEFVSITQADTRQQIADSFFVENEKAKALFKAGNYQAALDAFKKGEQANSANSLYNQGNALAQLQQYEQAIEHYEQALKKNPDLQDAKENLEKIKQLKQQQEKQQGEQSNDQQSQDSKDQQGEQQQDQQSQDQQSQDQDNQQSQQQSDEAQQQQNNNSSEPQDQEQTQENQQQDRSEQTDEAAKQEQQNQQAEDQAEQSDKEQQGEEKTAAQIAKEQQAKDQLKSEKRGVKKAMETATAIHVKAEQLILDTTAENESNKLSAFRATSMIRRLQRRIARLEQGDTETQGA